MQEINAGKKSPRWMPPARTPATLHFLSFSPASAQRPASVETARNQPSSLPVRHRRSASVDLLGAAMATRTKQVFDAVEISIRKRQRNLAQQHLCDDLESDASSSSTSSTYFNGSAADVDSLLDTGVAPMIPGDDLGAGESQSDSATGSERRLRTNLRFLEAMSAINYYEMDVDPNNVVSYTGLAVGARVASGTVDRVMDHGVDGVSGRYIPLHPRETRKSMWNKRLETMCGTGRISRGSGPKPKANINVSESFSSYTYFFAVLWLRKFEGSLPRLSAVGHRVSERRSMHNLRELFHTSLLGLAEQSRRMVTTDFVHVLL
jgi:hypothetical protein